LLCATVAGPTARQSETAAARSFITANKATHRQNPLEAFVAIQQISSEVLGISF